MTRNTDLFSTTTYDTDLPGTIQALQHNTTPTSEANNGAHVAEHVAQGDGGQALDVFHGQAGCLAELQEPEGKDEDGAHDQLGHADAPREGDGVQGFLK